jgi:aspartate kinase
LLSMALNAKQCSARSFTGTQIGIQTDNVHTKARIMHIKHHIIEKELAHGRVVIIAGFQGVNEFGDITTLGRGGSDTTAVAIAAAIHADECQIYTDVDGVYTTDPHLIPDARLIPQISFDEMLEMASLGAKVLQMHSVELASKHQMPIRVLSTFSDGPGTLVTFEDKIMHKRPVSGIAFSREEAIITLMGMPKRIGLEGDILSKLDEAHIEIDMIAQNVNMHGMVDFTFTVQRKEYPKAIKIAELLAKELHAASMQTHAKVAKLSLVGIGMRTQTKIASTMLKTLGQANIAIQLISTSEIKLSVIIDETQLEKGVQTLHQVFELDKLHVIPAEAEIRTEIAG